MAGVTGTADRRESPAEADAAGCRGWSGHVVVCGLEDLGLRTVEQLHHAGARVAVLDERRDGRFSRIVRGWGIPVIVRDAHLAEPFFEAGIEGAAAVICVEASDLRTLETVLLVRELRPDVRVVAHIDNAAVANAVEEVTGADGVLDVPSLFAPSVVEVCLERRLHEIRIGSTQFATVEVVAPHEATLRELYGSLVPLGVATDREQEPIVCPGRDERVEAGDRVTLLGTLEALDEAGLRTRAVAGGEGRARRPRVGALRRLLANVSHSTDRALRVALWLGLWLIVISTLVLHFGFRNAGGGQLGILNSVYFTVETIATVGFGDFSFSHQPVWMEAFGIVLIVAGTTLVTATFALLTNALVSRRIERSLGHAQIPGMAGHVVVVGLGSVGMGVIEGVIGGGGEVVVVERADSNRYLNQVRQHGVPLVIGDATLGQTLNSVNLSRAAAVAIMTSDDMANIEVGLAVRDRLGERWVDVPVVLRVFDRELGARLEQSFGFRHVWSTSAISAPWLVGAVLGMDVLFSFYVGNHPFLLARLQVGASGGLEGLAMNELGARMRVIAIGRGGSDGELEYPPRRDTRLLAGDDAYLAGPYEELQRVLRREREGSGGA
jgi:Trk K+ transport system NAD-binding subunit